MWEKLGNDRAFFVVQMIKNFELERDLSRVFSPLNTLVFYKTMMYKQIYCTKL